MGKIKVLHVTFDMTIGGAQQVIRQLVENIDEAIIQSEIVCIDNRLGELGETLRSQGIEVHLLGRQQGFDVNLIKQLHRLIKHNNFDVVHCHQYSPYVYGVLASMLTSSKVIFTEHGRFYPDYGTWKRKLINPIFNLFTSKITAISKATKDALVEFESFKSTDIDVIYNGIKNNSDIEVDEIKIKKQFNIPIEAFIFGTISRLQPIKNQSMMIRSFKKVSDVNKKVHLLIVGDGEIKQELEALVSELGLNEKVVFTGFQKDPYYFHKIINVFLLPSFSEGASMTLLEAMSFSTPCVVTDVGGNAELVEHNITGLVVPNDDEVFFTEALNSLLTNNSLRDELGINGLRVFNNRFTVEGMTQSFMQLYKS